MSFNKIIVVGNLGRDPELRYTPQGNAVCSFSIATNEKRRDKSGELQPVTTWFRVTLWGNQAENASKYLTKGSSVYIEGRLRTEEWTDRDGKLRTSLEINGTEMQFIGGRDSGEYSGGGISDDTHSGPPVERAASSSGNATSSSSAPAPAANDDEIPF